MISKTSALTNLFVVNSTTVVCIGNCLILIKCLCLPGNIIKNLLTYLIVLN